MRLLHTLADIGPRRLQQRLRYELRQRLDRRLPVAVALLLARATGPLPAWRPAGPALAQPLLAPPVAATPEAVGFTFLAETRRLAWPLRWNDPGWPRLWQFHLHYFDWARSWLEEALEAGRWPPDAAALEPLLEAWIAANAPGRGDGWHPYTLSLRLRTWSLLLWCCPDLAQPQRLDSLWRQLCWLEAHPERCLGGNHWLENLTALAQVSLGFGGRRSRRIGARALRLLQRELGRQILADGGHQERSASYHLLMLDRLVELGCLLEANAVARPDWLQEAVQALAAWAAVVRLEGGGFPRCNDSAADACPALDEVVAFARAWLDEAGVMPPRCALRRRLLAAAGRVPALQAAAGPPQASAGSLSGAGMASGASQPPAPQPPILELPDTGWTLLRPGGGWELVFRCGPPCPLHLPAHVHADQAGFDLFHHGVPLLAEAGTSVYGRGPRRRHERSGAAHNVLQVGLEQGGRIRWLESVEVWGGFRAGRKARPLGRAAGESAPGRLWVRGGHDGFRQVVTDYLRELRLERDGAGTLALTVTDRLRCRRPLPWRSWWQFGPVLPLAVLAPLQLQIAGPGAWSGRLELQPGGAGRLEPVLADQDPAAAVGYRWHRGWLASGFGWRRPRPVLELAGWLPAGEHALTVRLQLPAGLLSPPSR